MSVTDTAPAASDDVRPVVATGNPGRLGLIAFIVLMLLGGAWIFSLMSQQRAAIEGDSELAVIANGSGMISSPPPLALPPGYGDDAFAPRTLAYPRIVRAIPAGQQAPTVPPPVPFQRTTQPSSSPPPPTYDRQQPVYTQPQPVLPHAAENAVEPVVSVETEDGRVAAGRFRNPSVTVPQGTVIPAVLETALDSTRPGGVRALVQNDIHSFDGSRVLIHRGSRLYGEYEGDLQRGQNRALIRWTRLIRPDGVTIALDSPASDPLGRAGVRGKVDSKFFQRFGGALLQSVLDIGVGIAASRASNGVIVALPGSTQNVTPRASQTEVVPTLKVRHGTSVSVFVAHDLDFSGVET